MSYLQIQILQKNDSENRFPMRCKNSQKIMFEVAETRVLWRHPFRLLWRVPSPLNFKQITANWNIAKKLFLLS